MSRNKNLLKTFDVVCRVKQWLYANPDNSFEIENVFHAPMRVTMNDDMALVTTQDICGKKITTVFDTQLDHQTWLAILEQLADQPSETVSCSSRLQEILYNVAAIKVLNDDKASIDAIQEYFCPDSQKQEATP